MKNTLQVSFLADTRFNDPLEKISDLFMPQDFVPINHMPWLLPGTKPQVSFKIAYCHDAIFLKFAVKEKSFKATYSNINDPVYKDSCVEFFISLDDSNNYYYNLEFNANGTAYAAYGSRDKRHLLDESLIKEIKFITEHKKLRVTHYLFAGALP